MLQVDYAVVGHKLEDMLLECAFQRSTCSAANFTHWVRRVKLSLIHKHTAFQEDPHYGNCYTFYANDVRQTDSSEERKNNYTAFTGSDYGLRLTLYTDEMFYTPYKSKSTLLSDNEDEEQGFSKYLDTITSSIGFRVYKY